VTFYDNEANTGGGAIYNEASTPELINVTISNNKAGNGLGGAIYNENSNVVITNSILYNNIGDEIYNQSSTPVVTYSIVEGGYTGMAIRMLDPLLGPLQDNGGFTQTMALGSTSPAIDAGERCELSVHRSAWIYPSGHRDPVCERADRRVPDIPADVLPRPDHGPGTIGGVHDARHLRLELCASRRAELPVPGQLDAGHLGTAVGRSDALHPPDDRLPALPAAVLSVGAAAERAAGDLRVEDEVWEQLPAAGSDGAGVCGPDGHRLLRHRLGGEGVCGWLDHWPVGRAGASRSSARASWSAEAWEPMSSSEPRIWIPMGQNIGLPPLDPQAGISPSR
jgi:hypothetical protein